MRNAPTALVIGPIKAGTSWLNDYLSLQGNVCLPNGIKETFFFDRNYSRGMSWYQAHFAHYDPQVHAAILEIAPSYFGQPMVPELVHKHLGVIPLVATLRHPVLRSWSHYLHLLRYGYTRAPLSEAVERFPQIITESFYTEKIQIWCDVFGAEHIHALWIEDLIAAPDRYAATFCGYLGVPFKGLPERARVSSNAAAVPPSTELAVVGRKMSYLLRSAGLYGVINFAKSLGLKNLFFGDPSRSNVPKLSVDDAQWLADMLADDFGRLPDCYRHEAVQLESGAADRNGKELG